MPRTEVLTLVRLSERSFEGDPHQSLIANLRRLRRIDWNTPPPGGRRTIGDILEHVGWAKWMYADYAFGSASLPGDKPPMIPKGGASVRPTEELMIWIKEGHQKWISAVESLQDDELDVLRLTNWGERLSARHLIENLICHDLYHAGEVNHVRAILQNDDQWRY